MNKKLGLAVAGALVALSSTANAGITIPAGDWTLDVGGVVNAYYTSTSFSGKAAPDASAPALDGAISGNDGKSVNNITTGLLPNYLSISGKSRQNDLDIGFTISINPGASTTQAGIQSAQQENRQAFLTIGDASWGSVKLGKDLGIFASDAILNDMTLLGVGSGAGTLAGNTTTLGRIGTGFMYADWKSQVAYTSPNWNGFQFTAGVTQSFNAINTTGVTNGDEYVNLSAYSTGRGGNMPAFEAKASYAWTGDFAGKVWVSGISQKVTGLTATTGYSGTDNTYDVGSSRANAWDIGANVNVAGVSLTGYYYQGRGIGQTVQLNNGFDMTGKRRDSKGGYVQAMYVLPTATKIGASWGRSTLEANSQNSEYYEYGMDKDTVTSMMTVGAYHPLTKSVNLVAEYSVAKSSSRDNYWEENFSTKAKTVSLGAILFF